MKLFYFLKKDSVLFPKKGKPLECFQLGKNSNDYEGSRDYEGPCLKLDTMIMKVPGLKLNAVIMKVPRIMKVPT